jgi:hypothetical protein
MVIPVAFYGVDVGETPLPQNVLLRFFLLTSAYQLCVSGSLGLSMRLSRATVCWHPLSSLGRNTFMLRLSPSTWSERVRGPPIVVGILHGLSYLPVVLIAFRVWQIQSSVATSAINKRKGGGALSIVVESGLSIILLLSAPFGSYVTLAAIYSVALCCLIGLGSADNSAMFFFLNSVCPVASVTFNNWLMMR